MSETQGVIIDMTETLTLVRVRNLSYVQEIEWKATKLHKMPLTL